MRSVRCRGQRSDTWRQQPSHYAGDSPVRSPGLESAGPATARHVHTILSRPLTPAGQAGRVKPTRHFLCSTITAKQAACQDKFFRQVSACQPMVHVAHRQGEEVEDLCAVPPCIGIAVLPLALVVESIHLRATRVCIISREAWARGHACGTVPAHR